MADPVTIQELINAGLDADTLAQVAMSDGYTADTTTNRDAVLIDTVEGRLKKLGYDVPISYAGGIIYLVGDRTKTIEESGAIYAPLPSALPFTTSGTFVGDDDSRFFTVQNIQTLEAGVAANSTGISNLQLQTGGSNATNMGVYSGSTLTDNQSAKVNIQQTVTALETEEAARALGVSNLQQTVGGTNATNMGSYTGDILSPDESAKQNIQEVSDAIALSFYINDGESKVLPAGLYVFSSAGRVKSSDGGASTSMTPNISGNANLSAFSAITASAPEASGASTSDGGGNETAISGLSFNLREDDSGVFGSPGPNPISYQSSGRIGIAIPTNISFSLNSIVSSGTKTASAFIIFTKVVPL